MPENKNQSYANWPSVSGSRTTGGIDLRGLNPVMAQRREMLRAYQQRLAGDVAATRQVADINSRLTKITQDLGASSIARQEQLMVSRQANHQRMMELYGNYFQQFGNVLNKDALEFLNDHSKINVPTLTAIMAGYEHARASQAEQQLAMLDRQAKMAEAQYALNKQAADLQTLKEANDALLQQQNLKNQADAVTAINKSQSQYLTDVAEKVYGGRGVAGGRGTGVAGADGLGGSSAAGSFQAPVTGGVGAVGTGTVAGGGATGFVDPSNPQVAALNKMIDDSKAAQTVGQASQLGPLATQARGDDERITQLGRSLVGTTATLGTVPMWPFSKNTLFQSMGGALERAGSTTARGYFSPTKVSELARATGEVNQAFADTRTFYQTQDTIIKDTERRVRNWYRGQIRAGNIPATAMPSADAIRAEAMTYLNDTKGTVVNQIGDTKLTQLNLKYQNNLRDINDTITKGKNALNVESALTAERQAANSVGRFSRSRLIGNAQRFGGKLLGKFLGPAALILEGANWVDEIGGGLVATGKLAIDKVFGTGDGRTWGQYYNEGRNSILAAENQFFNTISGGRINAFLEDADVQQAVGRLRELGWGGEGSDPGENNFNIHQLMQMKNNDSDSFYKALDALYQYDPQTQGNISPWEYFNRAASKAAFDRTYATQANKAAQNQQVTNQEIMRDQRIADALAGKPKFFAGMAEYLTRVGREAGYDFDEADAATMMGRLIEMNQTMESGGKFGAEGANTSTGTAKSRHQFMDMTFDQLRKWMLEDDNKAGGIFFDDNERNALRQARTANDLDNKQFGYLLDLMVPYYLMKDNVNIGKFGKGNPNIGSLQALVDLSQMTKDIGISPYLDSSMNALRMAGFGRFKAGKEFDETLSRFNREWQGPIWSAQFGDKATSNGAYRSRDMYLQDFANNGILIGPYQNKVPANEYLQWVNEYFVVDKDGNITGIKEGANPKHLDKWREENGLTRVQKVATQTPITMSQYIKKLDNDVDFDNLNWHTRNQLNKAAEELGKYNLSIQLNSGYRSQEYQDKLRKRFESGDTKGIRYKPAKYSPHTRGDSIDIQDTLLEQDIKGNEELRNKYKDAAGFMKAFGFNRTVKGDDVHFELDKSFANQKAENQPMSLPSLPALRQAQPFSPALWTDPVVEPANQGIVDPLDLSAFDGMMPGGVNFSPTNYGVAMEQLQQQYPQEGYIDESMIVW